MQLQSSKQNKKRHSNKSDLGVRIVQSMEHASNRKRFLTICITQRIEAHWKLRPKTTHAPGASTFQDSLCDDGILPHNRHKTDLQSSKRKNRDIYEGERLLNHSKMKRSQHTRATPWSPQTPPSQHSTMKRDSAAKGCWTEHCSSRPLQ